MKNSSNYSNEPKTGNVEMHEAAFKSLNRILAGTASVKTDKGIILVAGETRIANNTFETHEKAEAYLKKNAVKLSPIVGMALALFELKNDK